MPTSSSSADPQVSISIVKDEDTPIDTLPYREAADDDIPPDNSGDPPKARPPTPSVEDIQEQMEFLPSDTREYDYSVHSTGHPAAPVIVSRWRKFDTPDTSQEVAQALVSSTPAEVLEPEPGEVPIQRKRRKVDPSFQLEATRSLHWKPSPKRDPDDDVPPSTV